MYISVRDSNPLFGVLQGVLQAHDVIAHVIGTQVAQPYPDHRSRQQNLKSTGPAYPGGQGEKQNGEDRHQVRERPANPVGDGDSRRNAQRQSKGAKGVQVQCVTTSKGAIEQR